MLEITTVVSTANCTKSGCGRYSEHSCGIRVKQG